MCRPRAWVRRIWRNCDRGARDRQRRLRHVGLRRTEKTRAWSAWGAVPHPGRTCPGGPPVVHDPGMVSVSGGASWEALPVPGRLNVHGGAWTGSVLLSWHLLGGAVMSGGAKGGGVHVVASGKWQGAHVVVSGKWQGVRIVASGKWQEGRAAEGHTSMANGRCHTRHGNAGGGDGKWYGCKWRGWQMAWV